MSVVILTHGGGRFANQLLLFAHLIAMAEEQGDLDIVDCGFWPYSDLCKGTSDNPLCFYSPRGRKPPLIPVLLAMLTEHALEASPRRVSASLRFRLPRLAHRRYATHSIDLDDYGTTVRSLRDPELLARLRSADWMLLSGWLLRDWEAVERHASAIRRFLMPAPHHRENATPFIDAMRGRYTRLVGLLVRRTDYNIWQNGRFLFPLEQYRSWIEQAIQAFGPDCGVLVGADEPLPDFVFQGLAAHPCTGAAVGRGHYLETMVEFAACDVVMSPPSTFSAWAAFLGDVPLLPLVHAGQEIRRSDLLERHLLDSRLHPEFSLATK